MTKLEDKLGFNPSRQGNSKTPVTLMGEEGGRWDPGSVVGVKRSDHVLVLGNAAWMPWLTDQVDNVLSMKRLLPQDFKYDKIVIGPSIVPTSDDIQAFARMLANGVVAYFPKDEGTGWAFKQTVEFFHPNANVWEADSTFGRIIMVQPRTATWRQ